MLVLNDTHTHSLLELFILKLFTKSCMRFPSYSTILEFCCQPVSHSSSHHSLSLLPKTNSLTGKHSLCSLSFDMWLAITNVMLGCIFLSDPGYCNVFFFYCLTDFFTPHYHSVTISLSFRWLIIEFNNIQQQETNFETLISPYNCTAPSIWEVTHFL